jgi:hypothetical protein
MDEGAINMVPRMIMRGFLVAHLTFGPQGCTEDQCTAWRQQYGEIGRRYLAGARSEGFVLPDLSPVLSVQGARPYLGWGTAGAVPGENNPCVGRFMA